MDTTLISYTPQSLVQGIAGAATGLTAVLVVIHIISRRVARASVWWDDGFLWFGCGMTLAMNALFIYGAQLGIGRYEDQVSGSQLEAIFKVFFTNNLLHLWAVVCIKASLLLFFHRMFAGSNKSLRWTVYFSLCLLFVWVSTFSVVSIFQCTPVSFFWDSGVVGKCMTSDWTARTAIGICDTVFNVATDFLCLMAPFAVLRRLQLAKGKKACLAVVYLFGGCIVVITVIRLLYQIDTPSVTSDDILYSTFIPTLLLILETNLAIACACLASFSVMSSGAIFITPQPHPTTPPPSLYERPSHQYSDTAVFLQGFKRQPLLTEWPILTTVTSNYCEAHAARLPSIDIDNFAQDSILDILKPAGGIIRTRDVEQTVERSDSVVRTMSLV